MATAICIRCGFAKRRASSTCRHCGLDPKTDPHALAQSIIMSIERFEDGTDRVRYATDLDGIGENLRSGVDVDYDSEELKRLIDEIEEGQALPWWVGLKALAMVMLWLSPGLLIIAFAIWLWLHR